MKVIGIDPGTATTGWAILTEKEDELQPINYGTISTKKNLEDDARILELSKDLEKIIRQYQPQEAAVESLFFFKNKKTVISVAQARGSILLTLKQNNIKVFDYTPLQVKQALTGYGKAEKRQMQEMVKNILHLKKIPQPDDIADAIAIALCHFHSRKLVNLNKNHQKIINSKNLKN